MLLLKLNVPYLKNGCSKYTWTAKAAKKNIPEVQLLERDDNDVEPFEEEREAPCKQTSAVVQMIAELQLQLQKS